MTSALPVLWLYGPSGVGKSTVAWELSTRLWRDGVRAAYVDVDQLGMCYGPPTPEKWWPEPAQDPGRHRMQTANLDAVAANARDSGAACLVVSGVVDPEHGIDERLLPNVALTAIRLRVDADELRYRLSVRDRPGEPMDEVMLEAVLMDRFPGSYVDTTGLSVDEVIGGISKVAEDWPGSDSTAAAKAVRPATAISAVRTPELPGRVLRIRGPREGARSMVGWQIYRQMRLSGTNAAYVDLDQLGFLRPFDAADPGNRRLQAANLAAVWRTFRAAGAECLVAAEPLDDAAAAGPI
ncbi:hypothetical protein [Actinospica sp.]|jgi:hypothetical protein|uniref:hypothetical protein n=1 Tax=Actinospica sp. TaxID=1872142 RepID=UPI002C9F4CBE|nr:hypothetical protein [Actinospica sp.]HWG23743.1 hypothetical protein [Actinospica sp.]